MLSNKKYYFVDYKQKQNQTKQMPKPKPLEVKSHQSRLSPEISSSTSRELTPKVKKNTNDSVPILQEPVVPKTTKSKTKTKSQSSSESIDLKKSDKHPPPYKSDDSKKISNETKEKPVIKSLKKIQPKPDRKKIYTEVDNYLNIVTLKAANEAILLRTNYPSITLYSSLHFPNMKLIEKICVEYFKDKAKLSLVLLPWEPPSDYEDGFELSDTAEKEVVEMYTPPIPRMTCKINNFDLPLEKQSDFTDDFNSRRNETASFKEYNLNVKFDLVERKSKKTSAIPAVDDSSIGAVQKKEKTPEEKLETKFLKRLKVIFEHNRFIPFPHQKDYETFFLQKFAYLFESNQPKTISQTSSNITNKQPTNPLNAEIKNKRLNKKNISGKKKDEYEEKEKNLQQPQPKPEKNDRVCNAILMFWKMGLGKSSGVLLPFSNLHVPKIYILCTNAMISKWMEFIMNISQPKISTTQFQIIGLTEFSKMVQDDKHFLKDQYVIFDEAHMFRSLTTQMQHEIECLVETRILLNLTGTPLMNDPEDLVGVAGVMNYQLSLQEKSLLKRKDYHTSDFLPQVLELIDRIFTGNVHYVIPDQIVKDECAPIVQEFKEIEMTGKQVIDYMRGVRAQFSIGGLELRSSNQGSFRSNQKKFSNSSKNDPIAPKFDAVVKDVMDYIDIKQKQDGGVAPQQIIYSRFLENGVNPIYKRLKHLKCKIGLTTGDNTGERDYLFES